ncbi:MAG: EAL domain-containing protein [Acidimicrobiales bacterium]|jgi:diguanylate cyclase (GGDEF)-like protein
MEQRETAGITIRLIIEQVRRERGEPGVRRLLELTHDPRPLEVLENPRVWHSVETRRRFFDAGAEVTGDPDFARQVGASILSSRASWLLRALFGRFGSPRALLKALPVAQSKFDTACESRLVDQRDGYARIDFHTRSLYTPSPHDCKYAMGLFSQMPVLFDMAPAVVDQPQCQAEGADHCVFEIRWAELQQGRSRWLRKLHRSTVPPELVQAQLEDLQDAVADLLGTRDVDEVIAKVTEHAGSAVAAQQLLLAVRLDDGSPIEVRAEGFGAELALQLGTDLLETGKLPEPRGTEDGAHVLVAEVCSSHRAYGKLVAFSNAPFVETEQQLLDAYARLAATTLDATVSLHVAAARQQTAEVLGAFAAQLIRVQDTEGIAAATVEAIQEIVSSDRSVVYRYLDESGSLATFAVSGFEPAMEEDIQALVISVEDTPELSKLISSPDTSRVYDRSTADDFLQIVMDKFGVDCFAAVPIRTSGRLYGVLSASWTTDHRPHNLEDLGARLGAIADQAAGAWEKASLLEQVHRHASIDSLTGLANRRVFTEMLARLLGQQGGPSVAVLFCDLDRFKGVNDALGHDAGDDLLVEVGRRLHHCVRSDDLVARLGGDEFTVLLTDIGDDWRPEAFETKIREAMIEPVDVGGVQVVVHLSVGAIVATPGQSSVRDILRRADAAMYVAKARGGDRLLSFEDDMLLERSERFDLEASLAVAAADLDQFLVLYQPQVDMTTGKVVGAEALVRWQHPTEGLLAPDRFLALAEETGLIVPIDLHVLRTALTTLVAWRAGGLDLRVAVNFSARTLTSPQLVPTVREALEVAGVAGGLLEIELTESTAVSDPEAMSRILVSLRDLGVSVAIDDVGTGYSSLALLHKLPAQRIKIDRSFVERITEDEASRSVVEAVLLLADRLGQSVIAEGVETTEQAVQLRALGCILGQGYLFARPTAASEVREIALAGIQPIPA